MCIGLEVRERCLRTSLILIPDGLPYDLSKERARSLPVSLLLTPFSHNQFQPQREGGMEIDFPLLISH